MELEAGSDLTWPGCKGYKSRHEIISPQLKKKKKKKKKKYMMFINSQFTKSFKIK
jgi:hypothetical protein